jgi:hypothetical protein
VPISQSQSQLQSLFTVIFVIRLISSVYRHVTLGTLGRKPRAKNSVSINIFTSLNSEIILLVLRPRSLEFLLTR